MTELVINSPHLSAMGRILIGCNTEEFTERFQEAVSAGASKDRVAKVMEDTLGDAVGILMENGYDAVGAPREDDWMYAFFILADMGTDAYLNGELAREDARCLTDSNYARFTKGTGTRSGGRPLTPVERARIGGGRYASKSTRTKAKPKTKTATKIKGRR